MVGILNRFFFNENYHIIELLEGTIRLRINKKENICLSTISSFSLKTTCLTFRENEVSISTINCIH